MLWKAGDLMAAMTSEVCLAWFRFTEVALAKGILTGPKTFVNTPIQKHMLHTITNTHHVSCKNLHMLLTKDVGSAVIVNLSLLFIIQLRCPNTQLKCQEFRAHKLISL